VVDLDSHLHLRSEFCPFNSLKIVNVFEIVRRQSVKRLDYFVSELYSDEDESKKCAVTLRMEIMMQLTIATILFPLFVDVTLTLKRVARSSVID
jgi:hypothetical protein